MHLHIKSIKVSKGDNAQQHILSFATNLNDYVLIRRDICD
jgi:hypothetical protein